MALTYGELFAGIGGFGLALERAGMDCRFQVEIDAACRTVLHRHWPGAALHEDVRDVGRHNLDPVALVCGGSPCQAFSLAGLRRSLGDDRGNLAFEFCRVVDELDPAWVIWENVPGVLNTRDNAFGCFLAALVGEDAPLVPVGGRWTNAGLVAGPKRAAAWRILDAQYAGVAQRRRRVFVVAGAGVERVAQVLFEPESLCGDTPPRRTQGQETAGTLGGGAGERGWAPDTDRMTFGAAATFRKSARPHSPDEAETWVEDDQANTLHAEGLSVITHALTGEGADVSEDGTGRGTPLVAFTCKDSGQDAGQVAPTLRAMPHDQSHANGGGQVAVAFYSTGGSRGVGNDVDRSPPSAVGSGLDIASPPAVAFTERSREGGRVVETQDDLAYALRNGTDDGYDKQRLLVPNTSPMLPPSMAVRRLSPVECARLQGFPDDWLDGLDLSDSTKYRQLGNAVCVNVVAWIARRIAAYEERT